jgi:hypothetical protein
MCRARVTAEQLKRALGLAECVKLAHVRWDFDYGHVVLYVEGEDLPAAAPGGAMLEVPLESLR